MIFLAAFLILGRGDTGPGRLELELDQYRSQELMQSVQAQHRNPENRIQELSRLADDPEFPRLPQKKRDYVRERLEDLHAYVAYEKKLREITDPGDARSLAQLSQIEKDLVQLEMPARYRSEWGQTDAGRQHADWLEDVVALRSAVMKVERWYLKLAQDGNQVLEKVDEANLPARARKVLQESNLPPFPADKDKLIPGSNRLTYATVFGFGNVVTAQRRWEEVKKKLEPAAKLEGN
jgi:hypothetical protein